MHFALLAILVFFSVSGFCLFVGFCCCFRCCHFVVVCLFFHSSFSSGKKTKVKGILYVVHSYIELKKGTENLI